jgi:pimeloyl-ACP methyl ester carboxylesterase
MMSWNRFYHYIIISLILLFFGCTKEPGNVAVSSDGVKISFNKQGKGKPAIIFVHGWTNNKTIWDAQVSHFSEKYKAIAVDLAGHGVSGNTRDSWTISAFSDDVIAVMNKLKLKEVILVGFSLGGPIVIETATKVPDFVKGVVLVDNLQNIEMKYPPEMINGMKAFLMDVVKNPTMEKLVGGGFFKRNVEESYNRIVSTVLDGASQVGWEAMLNEYFKYLNEDCIDALKMVKAPIVAINSDSEPTFSEDFRKYIPSFNAKIMKDVGHVVFWDDPDEFNRLLEESIQEF